MAQPSTVRVRRYDVKSAWRKSSYSDHNGDCVELAELGDVVSFRDSKDLHGPVVSVDRQTVTTFISALTSGQMAAGRR
uniref:DUF397 domain-containing protein n=1 Tax=Streptomyces sp. SAT1 TaxID=1849967 RepID=UPI0007F9AD3A|nr:DUF397 domain-containing protein [Streptomyces sp. SAT1]ANO42788.1 DUF397 domain-containing protein [Streptomyces sp. SAT1]